MDEGGRAPTPAFFTGAARAGALGLSMDELIGRCAREATGAPGAPDATIAA